AIDLDAIEYNFNQVRNKLSQNVKILSVVKADAYGHGAVPIAKFLEDKCDYFGVACIDEAMELIHADVKKPILILGYCSPELFDTIVENDIRISVFSFDDAVALSNEAVKQNKTALFHFCVDTGMSRIGFQVNENSADICKEIVSLPNIKAEGLFSHFATADESDLTKAKAQQNRFKAFIKMLEDRGVETPIKHINNSAGIMNFDDTFDMCRMGIITYGLYPSEEVDKSLLSIKPAMTWKTHISHIKTLEEGREISYGGTYVTKEERVIATIPVGYADGYPRSLSNIGKVIINGKYAPIVGRICMDQFMVDVTDIDDVDLNSEVILVGKSGEAELSMEEVSNAAHSFNYELPCRIALRVPRTYFKNSQLVEVKKYL
ncbi:MAG: alanine racemase, partial [Eubacterium sp.]|nr:alanine racemase [Eubacterium sp.]